MWPEDAKYDKKCLPFSKECCIMSRRVDDCQCSFCMSHYKLTFKYGETSGFPKFCPFCGEEQTEALDIDEEFDD